MKQKLFPGIDPNEECLVTEMIIEGISGSEWEFQITYNSNLPEPNDQWFTVYLRTTMDSAEKIGTTNRLSKAIEIVAKYSQIQIMDEDDSFINLVDMVPNYDNDQDNLEDEEINKIIVQMIEDNHKV